MSEKRKRGAILFFVYLSFMKPSTTLGTVILKQVAIYAITATILVLTYALPMLLAMYLMEEEVSQSWVIGISVVLWVALSIFIFTRSGIRQFIDNAYELRKEYNRQKSGQYKVGDTIILPEFDSASDNTH